MKIWQEQYITSEQCKRVRYYSGHENVKFHLFEQTCNFLFVIWAINIHGKD